jgi:hypothetical protein
MTDVDVRQTDREVQIRCEKIKSMRSSWVEQLLASLALVDDYPELVNRVGVKRISEHQFIANAMIHGQFTGRRANTVRLGFRTHSVPRVGHFSQQFGQELVDANHWNIHSAPNSIFNSNPHETFRYVRYPNKVLAKAKVKVEAQFHETESDLRTSEMEFALNGSPVEDWDGSDGFE